MIYLSICIPTYNRCSYLDVMLNSIVLQPEFSDNNEIEIVISDNCSTDDTVQVVKKYQNRYKNIFYHKNDENIGMESNFVKALSLGNGTFLKLFNDYIIFNPESFSYLKSSIMSNLDEKPVLFFLNNQLTLSQDITILNNIDSFVQIVSYWPTWISCFGVWKDYFTQAHLNKHLGFMFFHTSLLYENIFNVKTVKIYNNNFFSVQQVESKGGYDLFETFIFGYLDTILNSLFKNNSITKKTYRGEKVKFLKHFLLYWYIKTSLHKLSNGFNKNNALALISARYNIFWVVYFLLKKQKSILKNKLKYFLKIN